MPKTDSSTSPQEKLYARVALPIPVDKLFTYDVPPDKAQRIFPGARVEVPFGKRLLTGIAVELTSSSDFEETRSIGKVLDIYLPPNLIELARWAASYYGCTLGEVFQVFLPPKVRKPKFSRSLEGLIILNEQRENSSHYPTRAPAQRRLVETLMNLGGRVDIRVLMEEWGFSRRVIKTLDEKGIISIDPIKRISSLDSIEGHVEDLSKEQKSNLEAIIDATEQNAFSPFLIHGVTGSGKTEVYLRAAYHVISRGGGCIVLVPEIGLIPQAVSRFKILFKDRIAVLHSRLTGSERYEIWKKIQSGDCRLVLGPRSALFTPVKNLKLLIVDEEQDDSYKQGEKPRYHARNVALVRGKFEKLVVVLGSATPSAESYMQAVNKKYTYLSMPERIKGVPLPKIHIVDMREEHTEGNIFSRTLVESLTNCIKSGGQSILFLNKRGHSRFVQCNTCGWVAKCRNCDISLIYHRVGGRMRCHFCGYSIPSHGACPACQGKRLFLAGAGTQKIELDLKGLVPGVGILRMDADTTLGREGHRRILEKFGSGKYHILLGTQMVTKGHHFPGVHLVGVLSAEEELNFPDFRSAERTFRQLIQVSGRAGRTGKRGEVVVQTFVPDHYVFYYLRSHDYIGFMKEELKVRKKLGYPPFTRLISALCLSSNKEVLERVASMWGGVLKNVLSSSNVEVLGPVSPIIPRLKGKFRQQFLIKGAPSNRAKKDALESFKEVASGIKGGGSVSLKWDVDPQSFA